MATTKPKPKEKFLIVRVTPDTHKKFSAAVKKAKTTPSTLLRELVDAYIDSRIIIQPSSK